MPQRLSRARACAIIGDELRMLGPHLGFCSCRGVLEHLDHVLYSPRCASAQRTRWK